MDPLNTYFHSNRKVKCECEPGYGSDDCGVNLAVPPAFDVPETCCDTSTMNCNKIIGVSNKLSNTDELDVELTLFLDDGTLVNTLLAISLAFLPFRKVKSIYRQNIGH